MRETFCSKKTWIILGIRAIDIPDLGYETVVEVLRKLCRREEITNRKNKRNSYLNCIIDIISVYVDMII